MQSYALVSGFGYEHLQRIERDSPAPGFGEVRVRVRVVSLNFRDLLVVKGMYNARLPLPRVITSDGAGEVVAIGTGVTRWQIGDRVAGIFMQSWRDGELSEAQSRSALGGDIDGMLTQEVVLSEEGLVRIPDHLTFAEASTLPCAAVTAWHALQSGGLIAGQSVLIQGTGGVSIFALQLAKLQGARTYVISSSDEKLERVRQMGATATLNYKRTPEWERWVREQTHGRGVDHVIEVGGAGTLERSMKAVRVGGTIALIGVLTGGTGTINPMPLLMRSITLRGIYVGSRAMFEAMNRAIIAHQVRPVIDRTFAFGDAVAALHHLESAQHFGKVVIEID